MKNYLAKLTIALSLLMGFISLAPVYVQAADNCANPATANQQIKCGACSASGADCSANASKTVENIVTEVINILSLIGGALAVIMIIFGGFRYVTSAGNQEATKSAKNTIIYAVIGLVIIAVAQVIVQFVLDKSTDATANTTNTNAGAAPTRTGP